MTDIEIYESNLLPFEIKKRYGIKAQCRCPAHDDKHASLTITKGRKCTLFYCHAGCKVDDILKAAGLEKKNTFYDVEPINQKRKAYAYIEGREKRRIEAIYDYVSINGGYVFSKIRLEGKKILYGVFQNERFTYGLQGRNRRELKAIYGSVQAINKAVSEGKPILSQREKKM